MIFLKRYFRIRFHGLILPLDKTKGMPNVETKTNIEYQVRLKALAVIMHAFFQYRHSRHQQYLPAPSDIPYVKLMSLRVTQPDAETVLM
jgi:hypothetical protein